MSRIDELVRELAANGVRFKTLGEVATLVRGNGMPKIDLTDEGVGAIHYGQIYTHYGVWTTNTISFVTPETAAKLVKAETGDIIITNTSENIEDVGKAVAWLGDKPIVTGGHATVIKHHEDPKYLSYWFQSESFFVQKRALATGTKVIDVSAKQLMKVRVPVPPLEVQQEVVRILDQFTQLETELEAELEARRRQYEHYRHEALSFNEDVKLIPLGDVCRSIKTGKLDVNAKVEGGLYPFFTCDAKPYSIDTFAFDTEAVLISGNGSRLGHVNYYHGKFNAYQRTYVLSDFSSSVTVSYLLQYLNAFFRNYVIINSRKGSVPYITLPMLRDFGIPIPSLEEQKRIASILDKFDALVNDLSVGLPAELAARRKQYEYYRDRLLTFEEAVA